MEIEGAIIRGAGRWRDQRCDLLLEGGRIKEIKRSSRPAATSRTGRLGQDLYVVPGLWDVHSHPGMAHSRDVARDPQGRLTRVWSSLRAGTRVGVSGVRVMGEALEADLRVRDLSSGQVGWPVVLAAGPPLKVPGGHGHDPTYPSDGLADPWGGVECADAAAIERVVRALCRDQHVDWIKLFVSGGISGANEAYTDTQMPGEMIEAACLEAARWGVPVTAHAGNPVAVSSAVRAGVSCIEHGYELTEENVEEMVAHGTWLVPTLSITHNVIGMVRAGWSPAMIRKAEEMQGVHACSFRRARRAGVRMASGSDMRPFGVASLEEIVLMASLSGDDDWALQAGTVDASELCGLGDRAGTVEEGKRADLVLLTGDPREKLRVIEDPWRVVSGGSLVERGA